MSKRANAAMESEELDAYRDWLDITDTGRPPNHYQLLGLRTFEPNAEKIWSAAMARMAVALEHDPGPHRERARQLFDEIEQARNCLSDPNQKAAYDVSLLREQILKEPESAEPSERASAEHVLNEADSQQMMVVAENLSDSQAVLLKSRLATLKPKHSAGAKAPSSYYGPRSFGSALPRLGRPGKRSELLQVGVAALVTALVVLALWLGLQQVFKEPPPPDPLAPYLARLSSPDVKVRLESVRAIGRMGPRTIDAAPQLVEVLKADASDEVRYAAAQALAEAGPGLLVITDQLNALVDREQNPAVRRLIKGLIQASEGP